MKAKGFFHCIRDPRPGAFSKALDTGNGHVRLVASPDDAAEIEEGERMSLNPAPRGDVHFDLMNPELRGMFEEGKRYLVTIEEAPE